MFFFENDIFKTLIFNLANFWAVETFCFILIVIFFISDKLLLALNCQHNFLLKWIFNLYHSSSLIFSCVILSCESISLKWLNIRTYSKNKFLTYLIQQTRTTFFHACFLDHKCWGLKTAFETSNFKYFY